MTRKILLTIALAVIGVFIQGTLLGSILPAAFVPNIVLTLALFFPFYEVSALGAALAFLVGLILDIYSATMLGPWAGTASVLFGFLTLLSRGVFIESYLAAFVSVFVATILGNVLYLVLVNQFGPSSSDIFSWKLLLNSVVTAAIAPFVFYVCKGLYKKRGPHSRRAL